MVSIIMQIMVMISFVSKCVGGVKWKEAAQQCLDVQIKLIATQYFQGFYVSRSINRNTAAE